MPPTPVPPGPQPPGPGPTPGPTPTPLEQGKKDILEAATARLAQLGIQEGEAVMSPVVATGKNGRPIKVQTNVFGLELQKEVLIYQYAVHIYCDLTPTKQAVFTKKGKDDFVVLDRHEKCVAIMSSAKESFADFFKIGVNNEIFYDGQSLLYSLCDLFSDNVGRKKIILEVSGKHTSCPDLEPLDAIFVEIFVGTEGSQNKNEKVYLTPDNLTEMTANSNLDLNDRSMAQFLEIALNQFCLLENENHAVYEHGKVYMRKPEKYGFRQEDVPDVGEGKRLAIGTKKSLQFIEGPGGRKNNNPALVVDSMKAAVHEELNCLDKVQRITKKNLQAVEMEPRDIALCETVMRGLDVYTKHSGKIRHHVIHSVTKKSANNSYFDVNGEKVLLSNYFKIKYDVQLKYPNAPLLVCKERGNLNFYPLELCTVSPMQRVTVPQTTPEQSQKTTKECAVPPVKREFNIMKGLESTKIIDPNNRFLNAIGLKVYPDPLMANARLLRGLTVEYSTGQAPVEEGKWRSPRNGRYLIGSTSKAWAIYAVMDGSRNSSRFNYDKLMAFAKEYHLECNKRGVKLQNPADMKLIGQEHVQETMKVAAQNNCDFIVFVTADAIKDVHGKLKLWERELQVITQDIQLSTALKVVDDKKRLTLENIINKTNMKLGGLNYNVTTDSLTPNDLILGVGLSNPPPAARFEEDKGEVVPTVVGFASNCFKPHEYVGDVIFFSARRQETLAVMEDIVTRITESFKTSRNSLPTNLIVYRSGVSEGSFAVILKTEIPLIRGALKKIEASSVKLVYVVVSKDHNIRIFKDQIDPRNKPTEQNIQSGIVVDSEITHPSYKEFYLNSHATLQGTAKTPRYTVLQDDCNLSMDQLEGLTYSLAHHHQIVTTVTSLPTPLYVANEYAKRGRNNFAAKSEIEGGPVDHQLNLQKLTDQLSYKRTWLAERRINA